MLEFATQINEAGRQLLGLINIILDVARIESGHFDLATDRVDVARLVRHCLRQSDAAAQAAEITLDADVPDDLPALRADERRLQQVVDHLLSNAVKFTEAGGTVSVGASLAADGRLLLVVRDTGIGIAEEDMRARFRAVHAARQHTGPALSGCRSRPLCVACTGGRPSAASCRCTARQAWGHPWRFVCRLNG